MSGDAGPRGYGPEAKKIEQQMSKKIDHDDQDVDCQSSDSDEAKLCQQKLILHAQVTQ